MLRHCPHILRLLFFHFSQNFAIIFTDGAANIQEDDTILEAINLKTSGVNVITMSVGTLINRNVLDVIASQPPSRNVMTSPNYQELNSVIVGVLAALCNGQNIFALMPDFLSRSA